MKTITSSLLLLVGAIALTGCCNDWCCDPCQPCCQPEPCCPNYQYPKCCCPQPSCEGYYSRPYLWDYES